MIRRSIYTLLILVAAFFLYSASHRWGAPETGVAERDSLLRVTDRAGRQVAIEQPVRRIVLMRSLNFYELVAVLGDEVENKLVGWDSSLHSGDPAAYKRFVAQYPGLDDVAVLGDSLREAVSAEAVLALQPDLVILNSYMLTRDSAYVDQLRRSNVPLLYLDFSDPFADPQRSLRLLGRVLGASDRAEQISAWMDAELKKVTQRFADMRTPTASIYMEAGTGGAAKYGNTFGKDSSGNAVNWGSILAQLRCRNIAAEQVTGAYGMGQIRPEYLLSADPDVIVITGANWTAFPDSLRLGYDAQRKIARNQLRGFTARVGWDQLNAVQNNRLYGIHTRMSSHVTSVVAAQQLAKWLYPDEFDDLDPGAAMREYYERFMPIESPDTSMVSLKQD